MDRRQFKSGGFAGSASRVRKDQCCSSYTYVLPKITLKKNALCSLLAIAALPIAEADSLTLKNRTIRKIQDGYHNIIRCIEQFQMLAKFKVPCLSVHQRAIQRWTDAYKEELKFRKVS